MTLAIDPTKAAAVLIAGGGWETIVVGTLVIERIVLIPDALVTEAEDYGFSCVSARGKITGRMSALLAVSEAPR